VEIKSLMAQAIPILSLIIAALAVFVGPMVTLKMSQRQIELSRRIAHRQIIAPMRQAWIEGLRGKLAELLSLSFRCWDRAVKLGTNYEELNDPEFKRILELTEEIRLLINPVEPDHKELVNSIAQITRSILCGLDNFVEFKSATEKARTLGLAIFKTEWNRIKVEIERP
jgi:hypothetical protein